MNSLVSQDELRQQFGRRRLRHLLAILPVALAFLVLNRTTLFGIPAETLHSAAVAVIIGGILFSFWNWRCPSCNRYVGRSVDPEFCKRCGMRFRD